MATLGLMRLGRICLIVDVARGKKSVRIHGICKTIQYAWCAKVSEIPRTIIQG